MTSYSPKSKYNFFVYINGQLQADLASLAENRQFSQTRNDSDQISFTLSNDKLVDLCSKLHITVRQLLYAGITEIRVYRNNVPIVAGELGPWNGQLAEPRKINLQCYGWLDLFKQRLTSASFSSQSALSITQSLVTTTLALSYGSSGNYSGFQIGTVPSPDETPIYGASTPLVYNDTTLYTAFTDFSKDVNGYDLEMTWDKKLNIYWPHIGAIRDDIVFTYPGNIKDFQPSFDPTSMYNEVIARGSGSPPNQLTETLDDTTAQQIYGLRQMPLDLTHVADATLLTNIAQSELNVYKQPLLIQKIMFDGSGRTSAPQIGSFHIGDLIKVYVPEFGLTSSSKQYFCIDKIEVSIGPDDSEDVTLTLSDPDLAKTGTTSL